MATRWVKKGHIEKRSQSPPRTPLRPHGFSSLGTALKKDSLCVKGAFRHPPGSDCTLVIDLLSSLAVCLAGGPGIISSKLCDRLEWTPQPASHFTWLQILTEFPATVSWIISFLHQPPRTPVPVVISRQFLYHANSVDNDNKGECVCAPEQERPCLKWLEGWGHYELLAAFCICCNEYWGGCIWSTLRN